MGSCTRTKTKNSGKELEKLQSQMDEADALFENRRVIRMISKFKEKKSFIPRASWDEQKKELRVPMSKPKVGLSRKRQSVKKDYYPKSMEYNPSMEYLRQKRKD